jgi:pimeloyl-ACP methyl ester carboxylesterase
VTVFALVHGAWHGAWCWERLAPELENRGHRVVAMDLPCDDVTAMFATYAGIVVDALTAADVTDVVVVGHSLGGLTIPLVAARRPVSKLVYLCAGVPIPGLSAAEQLVLEPDTRAPGWDVGLESDGQGRIRWTGEADARRMLYEDCEQHVARAAFERLRPQALTPYAQPCPLDTLPPTPSTYIVCRDDRYLNPDHGRRVARERLKAELVELPGSHSPMLSRPNELAAVLHERCHGGA